MNIIIDNAIYHLQSSGGISTLWRALTPRLQLALPEFTFDPARPADVFISTYYQPAPPEAQSIVICFDYIAERYPNMSRFSQDSQWKYAAVERAEAVIAISEWTASDVRRFQGREAAVAYLATTLTRARHEEVLAFRAKYNLPESYVLVVGRRDLYKNVLTYWQAARMMNPAPFTVCVGGEDSPIPSGVHLRLAPDELPAAYTGALCLVYPSLYEGFGLPVLEAYACGCPVVCGSGGALAEINGAACVVDVTKPREIAEAVIAMNDHSVRITHILKGYDEAKRFSWDRTADEFAGVIRRVVERVEA